MLRIKAARLSLNPKEQKRKAAQTLGDERVEEVKVEKEEKQMVADQ